MYRKHPRIVSDLALLVAVTLVALVVLALLASPPAAQ
jgi:hypothetical protein